MTTFLHCHRSLSPSPPEYNRGSESEPMTTFLRFVGYLALVLGIVCIALFAIALALPPPRHPWHGPNPDIAYVGMGSIVGGIAILLTNPLRGRESRPSDPP